MTDKIRIDLTSMVAPAEALSVIMKHESIEAEICVGAHSSYVLVISPEEYEILKKRLSEWKWSVNFLSDI